MFADFDRMFEEMFRDMAKMMPKEDVKERTLPDGSKIRQYGPYIYGYSMTMGPDGRPIIREFGNVKPSRRPGVFGMPRPELEPQQAREPIVDIIEENGAIKVIMELPGVDKSDINLDVTENTLTVSVTENRFYKELTLPAAVETETPKATYKNGVLEVTLNKKQRRRGGTKIPIE